MDKVLFVGDVNVDLIFGGLHGAIQADKEIRCESFHTTMGSSAVITAVAYANLGGKAGFCGLAGDDAYGRFMIEGMRRRSVDTSLVDVDPATPTGVTVNLVEGRTRSQVTYPGTIAAFDGSKLTADRIGEWSHIHFTGIYQQESFRPRLLGILQGCRERSVTTSLDTQWDSSEKWSDLDAWLQQLDYLFVNRDEAASITGERDPEKALNELCGRGREVIVKLGADGALGRSGSQVCRVPSPDVDVVDTTGAGDTFAAGFLRKRLGGLADLRTAMRYASASAAFSCSYSGGVNDALCDRNVAPLATRI